MENTERGDVRIKNALSRKLDIEPCAFLTKQLRVQNLVKNLLLYGNAIIMPTFTFVDGEDWIDELIPLDMSTISYEDSYSDYKILVGDRRYHNSELLHFRINPSSREPWIGESYKISLKEVSKQLNQAMITTTDFMQNKIMPSVVVKVDALTDNLSSKEGRQAVYENFVTASKAGEPWIVPAELIDVKEIKPLSLNDVAIKDTVELGKKTVASILGIPGFLLGVGDFDKNEFNHFVKTKILFISKAIEQELTKKLLYSSSLYFKFNVRSLLNYDFKELSGVGVELYSRGLVTGNEVRDWLGLSPLEGLDELTILENYIPLDKIADQSKLKGGENDE